MKNKNNLQKVHDELEKTYEYLLESDMNPDNEDDVKHLNAVRTALNHIKTELTSEE